jgi:predicted phosphodiesterase
VKSVFDKARPDQARVLVLHHNVLRGELSKRMGLAHWKRAHRRIVDTGADVVLCGHDHQENVDVLDGVVVSCAGTISQSSRGGRASAFHRICIEDDSIQVEVYLWEQEHRTFKRTDVAVFARRRTVNEPEVTAGAV